MQADRLTIGQTNRHSPPYSQHKLDYPTISRISGPKNEITLWKVYPLKGFYYMNAEAIGKCRNLKMRKKKQIN